MIFTVHIQYQTALTTSDVSIRGNACSHVCLFIKILPSSFSKENFHDAIAQSVMKETRGGPLLVLGCPPAVSGEGHGRVYRLWEKQHRSDAALPCDQLKLCHCIQGTRSKATGSWEPRSPCVNYRWWLDSKTPFHNRDSLLSHQRGTLWTLGWRTKTKKLSLSAVGSRIVGYLFQRWLELSQHEMGTECPVALSYLEMVLIARPQNPESGCDVAVERQ